ncbi:MAG TPA: DUF1622 domain-containing protein [Ktedonobacterales bacterium]|jgi:uncharacterized membrane protein|nr:DUF1622 domain-containing protein [Ktedonobacterales bacterium]
MDLTQLFKDLTAQIANWVEIIAALIIGVAAVQAALRAAKVFLTPHTPPAATDNLRLGLARWLAVALEFELSADVLRTAISPTWQEIGMLAAIAAIRTGLNYFLQLELDRSAARTKARSDARRAAERQRGDDGNATGATNGDQVAPSQAHDSTAAGGQHVAP